MIINFNVENYRSINDPMLLNLTAGKRQKLDNTIAVKKYGMNVLPVTGIYGANGSGKSNLIKAMHCMRSHVVGDYISPAVPFSYQSDDRDNEPSSFAMLFVADDGIMYHYGFSISGMEIVEEWLSAYYTKRESILFNRTRDNLSTSDFEYYYGLKFIENTSGGRVYLDVVRKGLSSRKLFLSELAEKNFNSIAVTVQDWFSDNLLLLTPRAYSRTVTRRLIEEPAFSSSVVEIFRQMDFDFDGFEVAEKEISLDSFLSMAASNDDEKAKRRAEYESGDVVTWFSDYAYRIIKKEEDGKLYEKTLYMRHKRADGRFALISIDNTSDGFKRVLDLVQILVVNEEMKNVSVVIDEIEQSLHTLISRKFIEEFKKNSLSGLSSQLVFITYDTNLLDRNLLRRDEIQFMEKDRCTGSSYITNYAEFKVIPGLNTEKGYLDGRFGAIPILNHNQG